MKCRAHLQALLFTGGILAAQVVAEDAHQHATATSRFQKISRSLEQDDTKMVSLFARTALRILLETHTTEIMLARQESGDSSRADKLGTWVAGVEEYASQLPLMLDDIDTGFPVIISSMGTSLVGVGVAGRFVFLHHPRADQQFALEQQIVGTFCSRYNCDLLLRQSGTSVSIPVFVPIINPSWSFTESGPICSSGGIGIQFDSARHLPSLKNICEQFFKELGALSTEISWQQSRGVEIAWGEIKIRAKPLSVGQLHQEHIVALNDAGDVTLLRLPGLFSSDILVKEVTPWLRSRAAGSKVKKLLIIASSHEWMIPKAVDHQL